MIQKGQKIKFYTKYHEILEGIVIDEDFSDDASIQRAILVEAEYEDMGKVSFIIWPKQVF